MAISIEEVERIAKLARLKFTDEEKKKMQRELSSILGYVEQVKEVASTVEETVDLEAANIMRDDVAEESTIQDQLVASAPNSEQGFIKVRSVLE